MKILWTRVALEDLEAVRNYISEDNPKAADDILEKIEKSATSLVHYPQLGRSGRVKGTRELIVIGTPYLIPYRIKKDRIEMLAVLHSTRRWPKKFSE